MTIFTDRENNGSVHRESQILMNFITNLITVYHNYGRNKMAFPYNKALILVIVIVCIGVAGITLWTLGETIHKVTTGVSNISDVEIRGLLKGTRNVPEFVVATSLPAAPGKMMVYEANREITENEFNNMAIKLGISGENERVGEHIAVRSDSYMFAADLSRGVMTLHNETPQPGYDGAYLEKNLPSDGEARKIADTFLDSHSIRPEESKFYNITHNVGFSGDPPQKTSESINVWYIHNINGYRVYTDKMYVQVGVHGLVQHMFVEWTGYKPYKEYNIITPDKALEYLKTNGVLIQGNVKDPKQATVTDVAIGYIGETQSGNLPYLIPVYVFEGVVQGTDGTSATFYQWIPATPELAAEIT
jgi:hypothetical protein